jgi:hypothetical protein
MDGDGVHLARRQLLGDGAHLPIYVVLAPALCKCGWLAFDIGGVLALQRAAGYTRLVTLTTDRRESDGAAREKLRRRPSPGPSTPRRFRS